MKYSTSSYSAQEKLEQTAENTPNQKPLFNKFKHKNTEPEHAVSCDGSIGSMNAAIYGNHIRG